MSIDKKLLTAYAFGELKGADLERAQQMVQNIPEARAFVDELNLFSQGAVADLAKEPIPSGKGLASIKAEIAARGRRREQNEQSRQKNYWREAMVFAAILLAVGVVQRKKIYSLLQGQQAMSPEDARPGTDVGQAGFVPGGPQSTAPQVVLRDRPPPTERNAGVFREIGQLDSRLTREILVGRCKLMVPEPLPSDRISEKKDQQQIVYASGQPLVEVQLTAGAIAYNALEWKPADEVAKRDKFIIVKKAKGENPAVFYRVPHEKGLNACGVQLHVLGMEYESPDETEVRAALNYLAQRIAEGATAF